MFSYKYCEIFKNTYFEEHMWAAASDINYVKKKRKIDMIQKIIAKCSYNSIKRIYWWGTTWNRRGSKN